MQDSNTSPEHHSQPEYYEIRIWGHLPDRWVEWFESLTITLDDDGSTRLSGLVVDQAALHGLLRKIRDLGMPLLSLNRLETGKATQRNGEQEYS